MAPDERLSVPRINAILAFLNLAHTLRAAVNTESKRLAGLRVEQGYLLCIIDLNGGPLTVSRLAAALQRAPHTLSTRLNTLERTGLIERRRGEGGDHRVVTVFLTASGQQRLAAYREAAFPILSALTGQTGTTAADLYAFDKAAESLRSAIASWRLRQPRARL